MKTVIEVLLVILMSILIVNEFWKMQLLIQKEARNELLDNLLIKKIHKEIIEKEIKENEQK